MTDADNHDWLKSGPTDAVEVAAHYDEWADTYDETLLGWDYHAPIEAAEALADRLPAGAAVLDVGCGTGLFGEELAKRLPCRIEGLDISAASLELAGRLGCYDRLQQHDLQVTPLPVADNAFDAAASIGVMTYIEDPALLLADLCRAVRPHGYILFTHREDRWAEYDFPGIIDRLAHRGLWTPMSISEPRPYLPKNKEFGEEIRAIHVLCRVR